LPLSGIIYKSVGVPAPLTVNVPFNISAPVEIVTAWFPIVAPAGIEILIIAVVESVTVTLFTVI